MLSNLRSLRVWTVLLPVIPAVIVVVACCAVMQGCGYTAASTLPQRYQTIHIPAARNSIKEYDLQAPLTNALIRKFTVDTRLRVVDAERADLQLETDIKGYSLTPLTYDDEDGVAQFQVTVVVAARLIDSRTGEELWDAAGVQGRSSFMSSRLAPSVIPR